MPTLLGCDAAAIAQAAQTLAQGGLVAFPTETVYGLGANATDDQAVAAIFATKGRPSDHPLIVHIASADASAHFAHSIPAFAQALMTRAWPGPLTLILARKPGVANASAAQQPSIGLRCPSHPVAQALLQAALDWGLKGISAPSANPFGRISPTTAQHVMALFADTLNPIQVIDAGACSVGIESTIIDCTRGRPVCLRPGSLGLEALSKLCGERVLTSDEMPNQQAPRSSGDMAQHYAPRAKLRIMDTKAIQAALDILGPDARQIAVYARTRLHNPHVLMRPMPHTAIACAQDLFAALHDFDAAQVKLIWVEAVPESEAWAGVRDRLRRAAATL